MDGLRPSRRIGLSKQQNPPRLLSTLEDIAQKPKEETHPSKSTKRATRSSTAGGASSLRTQPKEKPVAPKNEPVSVYAPPLDSDEEEEESDEQSRLVPNAPRSSASEVKNTLQKPVLRVPPGSSPGKAVFDDIESSSDDDVSDGEETRALSSAQIKPSQLVFPGSQPKRTRTFQRTNSATRSYGSSKAILLSSSNPSGRTISPTRRTPSHGQLQSKEPSSSVDTASSSSYAVPGLLSRNARSKTYLSGKAFTARKEDRTSPKRIKSISDDAKALDEAPPRLRLPADDDFSSPTSSPPSLSRHAPPLADLLTSSQSPKRKERHHTPITSSPPSPSFASFKISSVDAGWNDRSKGRGGGDESHGRKVDMPERSKNTLRLPDLSDSEGDDELATSTPDRKKALDGGSSLPQEGTDDVDSSLFCSATLDENVAYPGLCPYCGKEVSEKMWTTWLDEEDEVAQRCQSDLQNGKRLNIRDQLSFCTSHRLQHAHDTWKSQGYPTIDWPRLTMRLPQYLPRIEEILGNVGERSHFRAALAEDIKANVNRNLKQDDRVIPLGYYGTRGLRILQDFIVGRLSQQLRKRAVEDSTIAARGYSFFVHTVLVPELMTLLVMDDMDVDEKQARAIIDESTWVGELLCEDTEDVVKQ